LADHADARYDEGAMLRISATRAIGLVVPALLACAACEEKAEKNGAPREIKIQPRSVALAPPTASANAPPPAESTPASTAAPAASPSPFAHALASATAPPMGITITRTIDATVAPDPDRAIIDNAHMRAASCYDGHVFDAGPRSATISVTVIPTGKVTRTEVRSSDTTEADVLACLKSLGEGLVFTERFASPDGGGGGGALRMYAIDVAVVPAH
jgi:hypothetical protein